MTEMIERVAKAIEKARYKRPDDYEFMARAAIGEMSEPTEDMIEEGEGAWSSAAGYQYSGVAEAYEAMIDAALAETPE